MVFFRAVNYPYYGITAADAGYYADYGLPRQKQHALEYLSQFVKRAEAEGVKARALAAIGSPAQRIMDEAKRLLAEVAKAPAGRSSADGSPILVEKRLLMARRMCSALRSWRPV